jgi:glycosyltransferase involved in cell wall biosynthesis
VKRLEQFVMRTLVIAGEYPWPVNSGSRTRLLTALRGLARCGPTELFSVVPRRRTDWGPADPELALGRTVVDLDDLEDRKILGRLGLPHESRGRVLGAAHDVAGRAVSRADVGRWRRLYRRIGATGATAVVCSDVDARRARTIGLSRVEVVPNTCTRSVQRAPRGSVGRPPTVLFQGTLRYPSNADAARFLAAELAPALRRRVPDVQVRMVGLVTPQVRAFHDPPRVTVVGQVDDMAGELDRADAVVVPIRYGSGTRVKILEAFAGGIPVVSTSLGGEGLEVEEGREVLLADTTDELARGCARLLSEEELRVRLASNGRRLFEERYRPEVVEARVVHVAKRATTA